MNINVLSEIFKAEIIKNRPELNDFSVGSVIYTVGRAISATVLEVYNDLESLRRKGLLYDDNISSELISSVSPSLSQNSGTKANGYVLVNSLSSESITLKTESILTHPVSSKQYKVTEIDTIINPIVEYRLGIEALEVGKEYNLPAGTSLISIEYPRLIFTVGSSRSINYSPIGDIVGGTNKESNVEYTERVKESLLNNRVTQQQALVNYLVLEYPDITSVKVQTISNGLVTIWLTAKVNYTNIQLEQINNYIQVLLPIGVYSQVKQLLNKIVNIKLIVYEELSSVLLSFIKQLITNYVENRAGGVVSVNAIRNLISDRTGIIVRVVEPIETIEAEPNEKLTVGTVEVLYVQS